MRKHFLLTSLHPPESTYFIWHQQQQQQRSKDLTRAHVFLFILVVHCRSNTRLIRIIRPNKQTTAIIITNLSFETPTKNMRTETCLCVRAKRTICRFSFWLLPLLLLFGARTMSTSEFTIVPTKTNNNKMRRNMRMNNVRYHKFHYYRIAYIGMEFIALILVSGSSWVSSSCCFIYKIVEMAFGKNQSKSSFEWRIFIHWIEYGRKLCYIHSCGHRSLIRNSF